MMKACVLKFQAIINSVILSNMSFTKTSQKFGQWADPKASNVYGLGFNSENDLNKVISTLEIGFLCISMQFFCF